MFAKEPAKQKRYLRHHCRSDIHHIIRPKYEAGVKKPFNLTRKLKQGCTGSDVKQLQKKLGVTADGIFGAKTKAALVKYQKSKGWIPSGVVRTKTAHSFGWTKEKAERDKVNFRLLAIC